MVPDDYCMVKNKIKNHLFHVHFVYCYILEMKHYKKGPKIFYRFPKQNKKASISNSNSEDYIGTKMTRTLSIWMNDPGMWGCLNCVYRPWRGEFNHCHMNLTENIETFKCSWDVGGDGRCLQN